MIELRLKLDLPLPAAFGRDAKYRGCYPVNGQPALHFLCADGRHEHVEVASLINNESARFNIMSIDRLGQYSPDDDGLGSIGY